MSDKMKCPICNSPETESVYKNKNASFSHADLYFDLHISMCGSCGFIFQSSAYRDGYDEIVSKVYRMYHKKNDNFLFPRRCPDYSDTLKMIVDNFPNKKDLNVLEIGSNRGDMLYLIKERFPEVNILGIEPTKFEDLRVPTMNAFFTEKLFSNKFDVIIMQHVLEHIKYPKNFLQQIYRILNEDGIFYIEVPNIENTLKYYTEDFIVDHVNYFSPASLEKIMGDFEITACRRLPFLRIIAKKRKKSKIVTLVKTDIEGRRKSFETFRAKKEELTKKIVQYSKEERKIVFYGVSTYFRILFRELKDLIRPDNCFYYDDNFNGSFEDTFNLPRLSKFDDQTVAIICSNVYRVQETIESKLSGYKGLIIIRPWFGISAK